MARIVLTGVDGTKTALEAAEKAAEIASGLGGELHVLSAFRMNLSETLQTVRSSDEPSVMADAVKSLTVNHTSEAERTAAAVAETLRTAIPDLKIISRAVEGTPGTALAVEAERIGAEVIVVGNRRVQGPGRILGSIARTVAAEAPCDLYVVNTHPR